MNITSQTKNRLNAVFPAMLILLFAAIALKAEDGYRLWLRYDKISEQAIGTYRPHIKSLIISGNTKKIKAAQNELKTDLSRLLSENISTGENFDSGAVIVGTPENSTLIAELKIENQLSELGSEGFVIRSVKIKNRDAIIIASNSETGALYGAFHFLRLIQTLQPIDKLNVSEKPKLQIRMLDHWDNLDDPVERGYAGKSL